MTFCRDCEKKNECDILYAVSKNVPPKDAEEQRLMIGCIFGECEMYRGIQ